MHQYEIFENKFRYLQVYMNQMKRNTPTLDYVGFNCLNPNPSLNFLCLTRSLELNANEKNP